jgi:NADPH:quinone reductase-like Zn-dependent oxidoreductase
MTLDHPRMAAIRQQAYGGPEVLELVEVDRPRPRPTEVLVRVLACGVNPVDWKVRAGGRFLSPPMTVGWDICGVVEEVGAGVTRFQPGDDVFGMPRFPGEAGGYAQYVTARSRQLARKPAALSHEEAAGLPLAGLTAWQILVDTAYVQPGQRILVTAAGGGVGHLAVQLGKALGAHVTATARADKHPVLRELGADEVIDYTAVDAPAAVRDLHPDGLDLVVDAVGGSGTVAWLPALRPGGLLVPVAGGAGVVDEATRAGVRIASVLVEPDYAGLEGLAGLVDAGQLRVLVQEVLPLSEAARAHAIGEQGRTLGKLVLKPW